MNAKEIFKKYNGYVPYVAIGAGIAVSIYYGIGSLAGLMLVLLGVYLALKDKEGKKNEG